MVKHQSADREAQIAAARQASIPILAELAQLDIHVDSLADLVNKSIDYHTAVPLLLKWLSQVNDMGVKESLVRALTIEWGKPVAARPLIEEFRKAPETEEFGLKWAIGNALSEVAEDDTFDDIVELVRDKRHGRAREMLAVALGNMEDPQAVDVLIELLDDEQVAGHALMALHKLAPPKARKAIKRFADHPKAWVRNEARRALAQIDKKQFGASKKR
jgi:HEAT repeat protein